MTNDLRPLSCARPVRISVLSSPPRAEIFLCIRARGEKAFFGFLLFSFFYGMGNIKPPFARIVRCMKVSCIVCGSLLVVFGICSAVNAFFSFDLLRFLCFDNALLLRIALGLHGVCAAWLAFWLAVFRPQNDLR